MSPQPKEVTDQTIADQLYAAVICDALDQVGFRNQALFGTMQSLTCPGTVLAGRCRTTLWVDMAHEDPEPYVLELRAVDACQPGDVMIAAAGGSHRSGIWGELLTTASRNGGCLGAIVDGAVRDTRQMREMGFPVFARATSPYDSLHRQRVVDLDVRVQIGGVDACPGDLIVADDDGVVVVPQGVEQDVLRIAFDKVQGEDETRKAIRDGMGATEAYARFGIL